jgi:hypothetical protein
MNNGLNGRYLEQLKAWNTARQFAAELIDAFGENELSGVLSRWSGSVSFPSISKIKSLLSDVLFLNGHDTINTLARSVMKWDGWYENQTPAQSQRTRVKA